MWKDGAVQKLQCFVIITVRMLILQQLKVMS